MENLTFGDSVYERRRRVDKTLIYKEDVILRLGKRFQFIIDQTGNEEIQHELHTLRSIMLATITDM